MKIHRRILNVDALGRILAERVEDLADDGQGNVAEEQSTTFYVCEACNRPVDKVQDLRSRCVRCGRQCCATCESSCVICRRPYCGACRTGFAKGGLSVCEACLADLQQRLEHEDQLAEEKAAFERKMAIYGALLKVFPPGTSSSGPLSDLAGQVMQIIVARKLSSLERRLTERNDRGRRLLPGRHGP